MCWYIFFFKQSRNTDSPSAVQLLLFGDTERTSTCTRKTTGLTHLHPFPWQNTSLCPDRFPAGECSSCWQWVVVMSWAFPWQQLLCKPLWCPRCSSRWGCSVTCGKQCWGQDWSSDTSCPSSGRASALKGRGTAFPGCYCAFSLGCYQLPLKTRFLLQFEGCHLLKHRAEL